MRIVLLLSVLVTAFGEKASNTGLQPVAGAAVLSLAGDWKYLPFEGTTNLAEPAVVDVDWPAMRLPSNWFLNGKKEYPVAIDLSPVLPNAIINPGDLPAAGPERGLDYAGTVWFRRHFTYAAGGRLAILRFEMVDYFADVYVNGHLAGHHEGSFQPFEFEVSRWLVPGDNVVAVKVGAPAQVVDWSEQYPASWPKRQTQVKGIFGYHDTRPGGTSNRGQERGTGGIVGDVTLRSSSGVELVRAEVAPMDVTEQAATIRIDYVLQNWTAAERSGTLTGEIAPKNFSSDRRDRFTQSVTLAPGENRVRVTRRIDQPALWWSWDYGKPNLYQLTSTLSGGPTGPQHTTFGIRSIRRDNNWVWYLNGRRIFPRGSNYISTQWLSQADRPWYERDVDLMLKANLNSIRVHAHLEKPEFYEVADERGLMVWQDFPLQWGYSDLPSFHREATRQLGDMMGLFFNHPSIIVWSMHNEAPHAMSWMKRKIQNQNLALDEALLPDATRRDPTRVAHRDSGTGDGHPYPGWYGGKVAEYAGLPGAPFITEYGAQALPIPETMKSMVPAEGGWPMPEAGWDAWAFHNFQRDPTFNTAKIPLGKTLEEFIWNSQNYQAALLRFATEHYRRAKGTKVTGLYQFMFVDDWPSVTWSVVDYYRRPKRGYTTLAESMQPTLPSIEYAIDNPGAPITLWVVNDRFEAFPRARLTWKIGGQEQSQVLDVPADGVVKVSVIGVGTAIAAGTDSLAVRLEDSAGRPLGKNRLEAADFLFWKQ
ncbi:MAG: glycoside hydrolase family 2 TIM barrel-domain containing protein [Acidobacteriota bacterium]|nr:glycoside hydrolase family 2 TIM barrel-domain containing protein [Acidobacteriota bacterium]